MGNVHAMCAKNCNDPIGAMDDDTLNYGDIQPEEVLQRNPNDCFNDLSISDIYYQPQDIKNDKKNQLFNSLIDKVTTVDDSTLSRKFK